jgi:hypothetical protein
MKKIIYYLPLLILLSIGKLGISQNTCEGTIQASSLAEWAGFTTVGNGTAGCVRVCITFNNLGTGKCSGNNEQIIVRNTAGNIRAQWTAGTAVGTCVTMNLNDGYARLSKLCLTAGRDATITWETVNCTTGANVCSHCINGVQDADETGVDCGGASCPPCVSTPAHCSNGILDGDEVLTDCGGSCPDCAPQPPVTSQNTCPTTAQGTIYMTDCDVVGTPNFKATSIRTTFTSGSAGLPTPSPATDPDCGDGGAGTWVRYNLADGVEQILLSFNTGTVGTGFSDAYVAFYQGPNCSSLSLIDCDRTIERIMGTNYVFLAAAEGFDPNLDLWMYYYSSGSKSYSMTHTVSGYAAPPSNNECGGAAPAQGTGCNAGATGSTWPTMPGSTRCSGGNWGSNENTVYYTFTADETTGSISVSNVTCNDGTSGSAQIGVWTSCANVGTCYTTACFLGCAVGTGTVTLSNMVPGQTYILVMDGFAGDVCVWDWVVTGITLNESGLLAFKGKKEKGHNLITWSTDEQNKSDKYILERSADGEYWSEVIKINSMNNSKSALYSFKDENFFEGNNYYRLRGVTEYGKVKSYNSIILVNNSKKGTVLNERVYDIMGREFKDGNLPSGVIIYVTEYEDGHIETRKEFNPEK